VNPDRLSAVDATYLAVELDRAPLHVASLAIFDGGALLNRDGSLRLDEIRQHVESRLGLLPRLRQRVAFVPFGVGRPVWIDDVDFDISNHIDVVGLPAPHDEAALLALTAEIVMVPLERDQPLWHLRFITGLDDGRIALVERAHHAMVDGVSGVDVSAVLLDASSDVEPLSPASWTPRMPPSSTALVLGAARDRVAAPFVAAAHAVRTAVRHPISVGRGTREVMSSLRALRGQHVLAPHTSLNQPIGSRRHLAVVRGNLEAVRAAGAPAGATVNDVVLTAVAGGLRSLFLARGERLAADRVVKVLIPVSLRDPAESLGLGNRVGALLAALPVGIGDPHERLVAVASMTKELKASAEATTADLLLHVADLLPPSVASVIQQGVHHQPLVNMVVTNIPGPPFPLYLRGARMLEVFPIVPLGGNMDLEVAVLSYDGELNLGIASDCESCPDAHVFVDGTETAFEQLGAVWAPAGVSQH
jgi:WS/DGAT/MGAT family acyltransferase